MLGDANDEFDAFDGIGVDEAPLSADEESVLLPFNVEAFLFFFVGVLLMGAIVDELESDELAVEKMLVEGDPDEEVDEDDEWDLFLLLFEINLDAVRFFCTGSIEGGVGWAAGGCCICC